MSVVLGRPSEFFLRPRAIDLQLYVVNIEQNKILNI